jgi:hypothetical protein
VGLLKETWVTWEFGLDDTVFGDRIVPDLFAMLDRSSFLDQVGTLAVSILIVLCASPVSSASGSAA